MEKFSQLSRRKFTGALVIAFLLITGCTAKSQDNDLDGTVTEHPSLGHGLNSLKGQNPDYTPTPSISSPETTVQIFDTTTAVALAPTSTNTTTPESVELGYGSVINIEKFSQDMEAYLPGYGSMSIGDTINYLVNEFQDKTNIDFEVEEGANLVNKNALMQVSRPDDHDQLMVLKISSGLKLDSTESVNKAVATVITIHELSHILAFHNMRSIDPNLFNIPVGIHQLELDTDSAMPIVFSILGIDIDIGNSLIVPGKNTCLLHGYLVTRAGCPEL